MTDYYGPSTPDGEPQIIADVRRALRGPQPLLAIEIAQRTGLHPETIPGIANHLANIGHARIIEGTPRQWAGTPEGWAYLAGLTDLPDPKPL